MTGPDFGMDEVEGEMKEMARLALELWQNMEDQGPADKGDEGLTTNEYAELWGVARSTAKQRLKKMRQCGLMIRGKAYRKVEAGHWTQKTVHRPREGADGLQKTPE